MTVGAPGSGKSTYARKLDPTKWMTVCLDDIRGSLFGSKKVYFRHIDREPWMRAAVHRVNRAMINTVLKLEKNLILPNTHTDRRTFEDVLVMLDSAHADLKIVVFDVSWETLVARENARN